jgi:3-hydroxyacyl-CoA dehydrogenase/enoyl-CoA hydratase/3-hydroxybutyryl-CoA epimerase
VDASTAYANEAKSMSQLMMSETARNLVRVFSLQDRLKSFGKINQAMAVDIHNLKETEENPVLVHVIGGGVMGGDIAAWCALKGFRVTIEDPNHQALASTFKRALALFTKQIKIPYLIQAARDLLLRQ